jgi:hypothetical protein
MDPKNTESEVSKAYLSALHNVVNNGVSDALGLSLV